MAGKAPTPGQSPAGDTRVSPFKFLDPYGPEDATLFFGRAFETAELYARLYRGPVTVVYGESGTGKTSLIQCGLRNRVPAEDMLFVSVRTALDPETTLSEELQKLVAPAEAGPEVLDALMRRVIRRSYKTVLLVFDQFEEFFLFQPEDIRQGFGRRLSGWLDAGLNLRLLFAIREEYLARLTELEDHLPGLYENRLRLRRMSRDQAEEAIAAPCRVFDAAIEPELVTALLDSLRVGGEDVELPILQVVLDTLYRQAVQKAGPAPVLTLQSYRDLGEARLILARFVDDRLAAYAGEAEAARQALKALVTLEGTRRLAPAGEIAEQLTGFGIDLPEDGVLSLLRRLVNDRILREDPERHFFELRHDALAPHIRQWMSGIEQELVDIRQTLESRLRGVPPARPAAGGPGARRSRALRATAAAAGRVGGAGRTQQGRGEAPPADTVRGGGRDRRRHTCLRIQLLPVAGGNAPEGPGGSEPRQGPASGGRAPHLGERVHLAQRTQTRAVAPAIAGEGIDVL